MGDFVCYGTIGLDKPWTMDAYKSTGGYEAWERILRDKMLNGQVDKCASLLARDGAHQGDTGACSCCPCGERRANPRHALC